MINTSSDTHNVFFGRQEFAAFFIVQRQLSAVQLFSGAYFYSAKKTDIYFEVETVLCFEFYAFRDVFRRNGIVQQDCIVGNRFELTRTIPKN